MRVINTTKNIELASNAQMAGSFFKRTLGLMGRPSLDPACPLILRPCNSVHTCFMRFSIDVVFVSPAGKVVGLEKDLKPWRLSRIYWSAKYCIEFAARSLPEAALSLGDIISLQAQ